MTEEPTTDSDVPNVGRRLVLALLPLVVLLVVVRVTGIARHLDVEAVRTALSAYGHWALPAFVVVYGLGILAHIPGSVFVGAGVMAYGALVGGAACYLGALLGNVLTFGLVRWTGYRPLKKLDWPLVKSLMRRLDAHPTGSVMLIRILFPTTAPVNYVLALSGVPYRAYLVGSMIGVLPQLVATVAIFAAIFE